VHEYLSEIYVHKVVNKKVKKHIKTIVYYNYNYLHLPTLCSMDIKKC